MNKSMKSDFRARERRLKAKFRKKLCVTLIVSLLVGLIGGFVVGRLTYNSIDLSIGAGEPKTTAEVALSVMPEATEEPAVIITEAPATDAPAEITEAPTAAVTMAPTEATTAEPTQVAVTLEPTATPEPEPSIVPFGESAKVHAQMFSDGTVCKTASDSEVIDLTFDIKISRYLSHDYYVSTYSKSYVLKGDEAGVEFELTLEDYDGEVEIIPQTYLEIKLMTETEVEELGYQITDAEINAKPDVVVENGVPTMLYKRYQHSNSVGDMAYFVVTTYVNGEEQTTIFDLGEPLRPTPTPVPSETLAPIEEGSRGDDVKALQEKLIEKGYLEGTADGLFGKKTTEAIKKAQEDLGLEVTGIADDALQTALN